MPDTKDDPTPDGSPGAEEAIGQADIDGPAAGAEGDSGTAPGRPEEPAGTQAPQEETTSERLEDVQDSIDTAKDSAQKALTDPM